MVGNGLAVLEAVPAALAAFLAHPDQPRNAIQVSGTPTRSRRWPTLADARCVAFALPPPWLRRQEFADVAAVDRLAQTAGWWQES